MWRMLQQDQAEDYDRHRRKPSAGGLRAAAFEAVGLDWRDHTEPSQDLRRASDILNSAGNAAKARERLQWAAQYRMPDVVRMMVVAEREEPTNSSAVI